MALITCPECAKQISERAPSCPHCGFPLESQNPQGIAEATTAPFVDDGGDSSVRSAETDENVDHTNHHGRGPLARFVRSAETQEIIEHSGQAGEEAPASRTYKALNHDDSSVEIKDDTGEVLFRVTGNSLEGANLEGQHLWKAQLQNVDLSGANLRGADLREADLTGSRLTGVKLDEANLEDACLNGVNLAPIGMRGVNLQFAQLRGASLRGVQCTDVNCRLAKLEGADLTSAVFTNVSLEMAYLQGTNLEGTTFRQCNFQDAFVQGTDMSNAASFEDCRLRRLCFDRTTKWSSAMHAVRAFDYGDLGSFVGMGAGPGCVIWVVALLTLGDRSFIAMLGFVLALLGGSIAGSYRLIRDFVFVHK